MGGRAGSGGGLGRDQGGDFTGKIMFVESLKNIKDRQLYKETGKAIGRYYATMGLDQRNVKLADLPDNVAGVHVTTADGKSEGVYLNSKIFKNGTVASVTKMETDGYKTGFITKTNKPVAHTITHELAHSTWNAHMKGAKYQAAGYEIRKVYYKWKADKGKKGYGRYASTNVSEFWAETITKGVHGTPDKYTKALKSIAQKYKL